MERLRAKLAAHSAVVQSLHEKADSERPDEIHALDRAQTRLALAARRLAKRSSSHADAHELCKAVRHQLKSLIHRLAQPFFSSKIAAHARAHLFKLELTLDALERRRVAQLAVVNSPPSDLMKRQARWKADESEAIRAAEAKAEEARAELAVAQREAELATPAATHGDPPGLRMEAPRKATPKAPRPSLAPTKTPRPSVAVPAGSPSSSRDPSPRSQRGSCDQSPRAQRASCMASRRELEDTLAALPSRPSLQGRVTRAQEPFQVALEEYADLVSAHSVQLCLVLEERVHALLILMGLSSDDHHLRLPTVAPHLKTELQRTLNARIFVGGILEKVHQRHPSLASVDDEEHTQELPAFPTARVSRRTIIKGTGSSRSLAKRQQRAPQVDTSAPEVSREEIKRKSLELTRAGQKSLLQRGGAAPRAPAEGGDTDVKRTPRRAGFSDQPPLSPLSPRTPRTPRDAAAVAAARRGAKGEPTTPSRRGAGLTPSRRSSLTPTADAPDTRQLSRKEWLGEVTRPNLGAMGAARRKSRG